MNIIFGITILGIVYGTFNAFMGVFDDNDKRVFYGLRIVVTSMCAMMAFGAICLITFGGGTA